MRSQGDVSERCGKNMNFQDRVFEEIVKQDCPPGRAAQAQLAALLQCIGSICADETGKPCLILRPGRSAAFTKCFTLLEKTFNITGVSVRERYSSGTISSGKSGEFSSEVQIRGESARRIAEVLSLPAPGDEPHRLKGAVTERLVQDRRCARYFLAGQFLGIGTVRDPEKEYYLSFDILSEDQARQTIALLAREDLPYRMVQHARSRAIVARDSDVIVDTLSLMGAHVSMMDMENARIRRQVRGSVNRKVNCETANIMKTVAASGRQLEEIRRVRENPIWDTLPDSLRQVALLREQYPESSLQELGEMLDPPIGKSGVNHRLRRISAIAQELEKN